MRCELIAERSGEQCRNTAAKVLSEPFGVKVHLCWVHYKIMRSLPVGRRFHV